MLKLNRMFALRSPLGTPKQSAAAPLQPNQGAISKALLGTALLATAAGSLLSGGVAQAANSYACAPGIPAGPGGIFSINFSALLAGDLVTCGDQAFVVNSFNFGNPGTLTFEWVEINPGPGYAYEPFRDDLFSVALNFNPSIVGVKQGFIDYNVQILNPNYSFSALQLASTVAANPSSPSETSVIYAITAGPTLVSQDGAPVGPVPFVDPGPFDQRVTWNVASGDVLTNTKISYTQGLTQPPVTPDSVPGPLPLLGTGLAFGWSRKLRSRLRLAATLKDQLD
jgi:hypothetical protein